MAFYCRGGGEGGVRGSRSRGSGGRISCCQQVQGGREFKKLTAK